MKTRFYVVHIDSGVSTSMSEIDDLSAGFDSIVEARKAAREAVEVGGEEQAEVMRYDLDGPPARLLASVWNHEVPPGEIVETWVRGAFVRGPEDLYDTATYRSKKATR